MKAIFKSMIKINGEFYPAGQPVEISEKEVESLKKRGDVTLVDDNGHIVPKEPLTIPSAENPAEVPVSQSHPLEGKSAEELISYAEARGIDIGKATKSDTILQKIIEAESGQ